MEPEVSLPCSQEPTNGLNPDPDASSPQPATLFPQDTFCYYLPIYAYVFWQGQVQ